MKNSVRLLIIYLSLLVSSCSDNEIEYKGILQNRPVGKVGVWVIDGQPYRVSKHAELDDEDGPLGIGACVEVELDGKVVKKIETEDPEDCAKGSN